MRAFSVPAVVLLVATLLACGGDRKSEVVEGPGPAAGESDQPAPEPAAPTRRSLPNASPADPPTLALDQLERFDLANGLTTGEVTIAANDGRIQESIAVMADGNVETMAVSNGVNPVDLTVTLRQPIRLRAARVYLAGSAYDWVIEPVPGAGRLLAAAVPEKTWSQIDLPEPTETSVVRLEVLRTERDDFVHVKEIELYVDPTP